LKRFRESAVRDLVSGALAIAPIYLTTLLLLKAMKSLGRVVRPLAKLLPKSFPGETMISLLLVLIVCLLVGIALRTSFGQAVRVKIEGLILPKIPGYEVIRGFTRQLAGENQESAWRPAMVEIEQALVPAFIVEELEDGRFTVFVPSVPTPLAGTIYILSPERVHPVNVPFTHAIRVIARWGSGSKELIDRMQGRRTPSPEDEMAA
jgi:uncharacterized membrane protein